MDETTRDLLEKQIEKEIEHLNECKIGTPEYAACAKVIEGLTKAKLDEDQQAFERSKHEDELIDKARAEEMEKKKMRIKIAEIVAGGVTGLATVGIGVAKLVEYVKSRDMMFIFEQKGSVSSRIGQGIARNMDNLLK